MVGGQDLLFAELGIYELSSGVFKQLGVVECLELGSEGIASGEGGGASVVSVYVVLRGVDQVSRVSEKLQVEIIQKFFDIYSSKHLRSFQKSFRVYFFPADRSLKDSFLYLVPVCLVPYIVLRLNRSAFRILHRPVHPGCD